MGMTLKESQRYRYVQLCRAFNRACQGLPSTSAEFVGLSVRLQVAKGWEFIPKYMCAPCWVRKCGI